MAYSFESRHDMLRNRMRALNSRTVTYQRGSESQSMLATVYEMKAEDLMPYGLATDVRHFSLIIDVSEVEKVVGSGSTPKPQDKIKDASLGIVLSVQPMGTEPCFTYTTHQRKAMRIHAIEDGLITGGSSSNGSGSS